jgi:CubicO group peptidase (beta-lactamase class C family)
MKTMLFILCLSLSTFMLSCSSSSARRGDEVLKDLHTADGPGGAVLVVKHGNVLYSEAFGKADVQADRENTLATNFRLASVTKQFTAMAVMMLAERAKLSLDQTVSEFFPEFASVGKTITVRHLLTHTSGLVAYEDVMPESTNVPLLDQDVLHLIKDIDSTHFAPGTRFEYSNSGFALLALIVEKVSGRSFARFLKENIFGPLGMNATLAYEKGISEVGNRAYGYSPDTIHVGTYERTDQSLTSSVLGDGGIYSSVNDLRKWDESLAAGTLVSKKTMDEILSHQATVEEGKTWYGYGWFIGNIHGVPAYYHGGTTVGFRTFILRVPDESLTVITLFNRADARAEEIARQLAREYSLNGE